MHRRMINDVACPAPTALGHWQLTVMRWGGDSQALELWRIIWAALLDLICGFGLEDDDPNDVGEEEEEDEEAAGGAKAAGGVYGAAKQAYLS